MSKTPKELAVYYDQKNPLAFRMILLRMTNT